MTPNLKTWVEIERKATLSNVKTFRSILNKKTQLYAVVKSNAYGHGLREFSLIVKDKVDGFCVDSVYEGETLREIGIEKPILVLGPTLSKDEIELAVKNNIEITVSTLESLKQILNIKNTKARPSFHIKVDTGMHRQGFFLNDLIGARGVIGIIKKAGLENNLKGVYTHFASAKDVTYPDYTNRQIEEFKKARAIFERAGFKNILFHASATGGAILYPKAQFDMVRIGIGLYGYWPSKEAETQHSLITKRELKLKPVLSWKAKISEIKKLKKGDFVGYNLAKKMQEDTTVGMIPIGYWHGFSRALSHKGQILVKGKKCKIVGLVSMDLIIIECRNSNTKIGDVATIIGKSGEETLTADDQMNIADTILYTYEIITTINPLIKRVVV